MTGLNIGSEELKFDNNNLISSKVNFFSLMFMMHLYLQED